MPMIMTIIMRRIEKEGKEISRSLGCESSKQ